MIVDPERGYRWVLAEMPLVSGAVWLCPAGFALTLKRQDAPVVAGANWGDCTIRWKDPWAHPLMHPVTHPDSPFAKFLENPASCRKPLVIGGDPETGNPLRLPLWDEDEGGKVIMITAKKGLERLAVLGGNVPEPAGSVETVRHPLREHPCGRFRGGHQAVSRRNAARVTRSATSSGRGDSPSTARSALTALRTFAAASAARASASTAGSEPCFTSAATLACCLAVSDIEKPPRGTCVITSRRHPGEGDNSSAVTSTAQSHTSHVQLCPQV